MPIQPVLYQTSVVLELQHYIDDLRLYASRKGISMADHKESTMIVIYDVLNLLGFPHNAISMVLGKDVDQIPFWQDTTENPGEAWHCQAVGARCRKLARHIVETPAYGPLPMCSEHAKQISEQHGCDVTPPLKVAKAA